MPRPFALALPHGEIGDPVAAKTSPPQAIKTGNRATRTSVPGPLSAR